MLLLIIIGCALASTVVGSINCPPNADGHMLTCAFQCCPSIINGASGHHGYYCCGGESRIVDIDDGSNNIETRPQRFVAYTNDIVRVDYTLLVIGLIVSVVLSVLFSLACCLFCNGCWLHRRRNPQMYESVHQHSSESSFYPLCCGFGIPVGTIVFSTHPPQFRDESELYHASSTSSLPNGRNANRVRFNEDGTPKGVLKNNNNGNIYNDHV